MFADLLDVLNQLMHVPVQIYSQMKHWFYSHTNCMSFCYDIMKHSRSLLVSGNLRLELESSALCDVHMERSYLV